MTKRSPALPYADAEWLEPDGLGGFASGTVGGVRTRRYHALLLWRSSPASTPGWRRRGDGSTSRRNATGRE